jgi:superfamily II DNA or RNA helicase
MIKLRSYQELGIAQIDTEFRKGNKRVLLCASPGLGKSEMAIWMMERALRHNFPSLFIVRGRNLVNNISDRMDKNKVDHSVFMAKSWRRDPKKLIQAASVDTMNARNEFPFKDKQPLILLDEAHLDYSKVFEAYPDAYFIGLTGTPFGDMSVYDAFVQPIIPFEARDMGFLVIDKVYCPHFMDVSAVKMTMGDFNKKELNSVVTSSAIVGNVVQDWKDLGENRPTVCFATSIEHSLQLKQAFCEAGVKAIHCDASSSDQERKKAKEDIESGKVLVLCNVDIFSTGWDCPSISCIILARPTWSLCWYLQAVGRGVRSHHGKTNCIVLDNAGNIFRHGSHFKVRDISLDPPNKRKSRAYETRVTTCKDCYFVFDPSLHEECPECGWTIPKNSRKVNHIDGKLIEYEESPSDTKERRKKMIIAKYHQLEWGRKKGKLHPDWSFIQLFKEYSREEMAELKRVTVVPVRFLEAPLP